MSTASTQAVEVLRPGIVAVVESASDAAHYPTYNHGTYQRLAIPWLRLQFYDETGLEWLLSEPLERRFVAMVFTPGAIALPIVRDILGRQTGRLGQALTYGVGLVISATSLGGAERFDLSFLPEGSQISLLEPGVRGMAGRVRVNGLPERQLSEAEGRQVISGVTVAAAHAFGWSDVATLRRLDGTVETVAWRAQFGRGNVIVAVLPFERLGWGAVVELMLTWATRSRGCLILGSDSAPAWYEDVADGEILAQLAHPGGDQDALDRLVENFAQLRLCRDATWDAISCLTRAAILARLENDGTVEFPADGPGEMIYCRLAGVPRYLMRLRQAQADLIDQVSDLYASPTFHLLAMSILCKAAENVVRDTLFIPDLLRMGTARSMVEAAVARRVKAGNVDELLLPTANLFAAVSITGAAPEVAASMLAWIKANAATAHADHLAQARWAARAADCLDLLALMPEPSDQPDSLLGRLSRELDAGHLVPLPPSRSVASTLDAAILAYTHARWSVPGQASAIWDLLNEVDRSLLERSSGTNRNVEELCYRTAAEVLLDATSPLAVHPTIVTRPELIPRNSSELLSRQAAVEIDARKGQRAVEELDKVIGAARVMAGILATLVALVAIAIISMPFWLPQLSTAGPEVRISLATAAFVAVSTLITLAVATRAVRLVAPRWVRAVGDLVRALRRK